MIFKSRNKRNLTLLFLLFLCIIFNLNPNTVKADSVDGDIDTGKIDEFIQSKMKTEKIPGCSIAIVKDKEILYIKGYGVDGKNKPVTEQTPFVLGSVSKSFTGLAIAQLMEQGKIDIDAPVQTYLPWFTIEDKEAAAQITIKQLLSHNSGFSRYGGQVLNTNTSIEQYVRNLKDEKLTSSPGKEFHYSNINYIVLGEVVQAVSGISYEQYMKENIFEPLDMKHSYADLMEAYENGLTNGYNSYFGFMLPRKIISHEASIPAGYLVSTANDMAHYIIAELNHGYYKNGSIISEYGMDETQDTIYNFYAMGWFTNYIYNYHGGSTETYRSHVAMRPTSNLGIVMLFNSNDQINTILFNSDNYDDIIYGVLNIISGEDFLTSDSPDMPLIRSSINVALIFIILLLLIPIIGMFQWKKKLNLGKLGKASFGALIIFNFLLPILIAIFVFFVKIQIPISTTLAYTLRDIAVGVPDFGIVLLLVPVVLFAIGIVEILLFVKYKRLKE